MDYKKIAFRFEKLHLVRRILYQKSTMDFPLYPGQLQVLEFIKKNEGCTQSQVSRHLMITPASVALSTKRMEKAGLLEKRTDTKNLRRKKLYITEKGRNLSQRCREILDNMDTVMFSGFTQEELDKLVRFLDRLLSNLTERYSCNLQDMDFFTMCAVQNMLKKNKRKDTTNV